MNDSAKALESARRATWACRRSLTGSHRSRGGRADVRGRSPSRKTHACPELCPPVPPRNDFSACHLTPTLPRESVCGNGDPTEAHAVHRFALVLQLLSVGRGKQWRGVRGEGGRGQGERSEPLAAAAAATAAASRFSLYPLFLTSPPRFSALPFASSFPPFSPLFAIFAFQTLFQFRLLPLAPFSSGERKPKSQHRVLRAGQRNSS